MIAIQGHLSRGHEVIQILESLGGKNDAHLKGNSSDYYYIDDNFKKVIHCHSQAYVDQYCKKYTLEEFKKEFPFKIGDRIVSLTTGLIGTIIKFSKNGVYHFKYDNGINSYASASYLKLYKEMERNVTLTLSKVKEWHRKGGELKEIALQAYSEEELTKIELPKTWEEFCEKYPVKKGECVLESEDRISATPWNISIRRLKTWIPSKKSAEAHLALMQLEQLRDCWRQGWEPIWDISEKWCIRLWGNELSIGITTNISRFLTFPTRENDRSFS